MAAGRGSRSCPCSSRLTRLIAWDGLEYARQRFRICLLEYHPAKTDDGVILERDQFWKDALLSPPQAEISFDQTPAFDPTVPDPVPEFDVDQSPPDGWES